MTFSKFGRVFGIGLLLLASGCSKTATLPKNASAQAIYDAASIDMKRRLYPEAIKAFEQVRINYPYSPLAPQATLRSGDCHLKAGEPLEAIESYRLFLQLYPRHNEVPYATYRIGEAHLDRAPRDYWFNPPIYEKDLAPVKQGVTILQDFLRKYSASTYAEEARKVMEKGQSRLIDHEMYVAKFNYKRKYYGAALNRSMALVDTYPGHPLNAQAYLLAADASAHLGKDEEAAALAKLVIDTYPSTEEAAAAQKLTGKLPAIHKKWQKQEARKAAAKAKIRAKEAKKQERADRKKAKKSSSK